MNCLENKKTEISLCEQAKDSSGPNQESGECKLKAYSMNSIILIVTNPFKVPQPFYFALIREDVSGYYPPTQTVRITWLQFHSFDEAGNERYIAESDDTVLFETIITQAKADLCGEFIVISQKEYTRLVHFSYQFLSNNTTLLPTVPNRIFARAVLNGKKRFLVEWKKNNTRFSSWEDESVLLEFAKNSRVNSECVNEDGSDRAESLIARFNNSNYTLKINCFEANSKSDIKLDNPSQPDSKSHDSSVFLANGLAVEKEKEKRKEIIKTEKIGFSGHWDQKKHDSDSVNDKNNVKLLVDAVENDSNLSLETSYGSTNQVKVNDEITGRPKKIPRYDSSLGFFDSHQQSNELFDEEDDVKSGGILINQNDSSISVVDRNDTVNPNDDDVVGDFGRTNRGNVDDDGGFDGLYHGQIVEDMSQINASYIDQSELFGINNPQIVDFDNMSPIRNDLTESTSMLSVSHYSNGMSGNAGNVNSGKLNDNLRMTKKGKMKEKMKVRKDEGRKKEKDFKKHTHKHKKRKLKMISDRNSSLLLKGNTAINSANSELVASLKGLAGPYPRPHPVEITVNGKKKKKYYRTLKEIEQETDEVEKARWRAERERVLALRKEQRLLRKLMESGKSSEEALDEIKKIRETLAHDNVTISLPLPDPEKVLEPRRRRRTKKESQYDNEKQDKDLKSDSNSESVSSDFAKQKTPRTANQAGQIVIPNQTITSDVPLHGLSLYHMNPNNPLNTSSITNNLHNGSSNSNNVHIGPSAKSPPLIKGFTGSSQAIRSVYESLMSSIELESHQSLEEPRSESLLDLSQSKPDPPPSSSSSSSSNPNPNSNPNSNSTFSNEQTIDKSFSINPDLIDQFIGVCCGTKQLFSVGLSHAHNMLVNVQKQMQYLQQAEANTFQLSLHQRIKALQTQNGNAELPVPITKRVLLLQQQFQRKQEAIASALDEKLKSLFIEVQEKLIAMNPNSNPVQFLPFPSIQLLNSHQKSNDTQGIACEDSLDEKNGLASKNSKSSTKKTGTVGLTPNFSVQLINPTLLMKSSNMAQNPQHAANRPPINLPLNNSSSPYTGNILPQQIQQLQQLQQLQQSQQSGIAPNQPGPYSGLQSMPVQSVNSTNSNQPHNSNNINPNFINSLPIKNPQQFINFVQSLSHAKTQQMRQQIMQMNMAMTSILRLVQQKQMMMQSGAPNNIPHSQNQPNQHENQHFPNSTPFLGQRSQNTSPIKPAQSCTPATGTPRAPTPEPELVSQSISAEINASPFKGTPPPPLEKTSCEPPTVFSSTNKDEDSEFL